MIGRAEEHKRRFRTLAQCEQRTKVRVSRNYDSIVRCGVLEDCEIVSGEQADISHMGGAMTNVIQETRDARRQIRINEESQREEAKGSSRS